VSRDVHRNWRFAMPYVQLRVAGQLSREQKETIAREFTATLERVAGKPPGATYVVIEEVPRGNWAKGGVLLE
jgi:4-oxalocrotonate tautomerase